MSATLKRNPATRLREILTRALSGDQHSAREVWCGVFEISHPDSENALLEVQSRLISLRKLFSDTESAVRNIPNVNEDLFIAPLQRLSSVVNLNALHERWVQFSRHLGTNDMHSLQFVEDLLKKNAQDQENEIPGNEIKELLAELHKFYETILSSALPEKLKTDLLDLIQEMIRGIHEYRVRGAVALEEVLTKSIGVMAANKQAIEENRDSAEIQALGNMLIRMDKAYSFAMKMQPLLQAAANLFPAFTAHLK